MRTPYTIVSMLLGALCTMSASFGQARLFTAQNGQPAVSPPGGVTVNTSPGAVVLMDTYMEMIPPPVRMAGVQVSMPCSVPCSGGGSVDYFPPVMQDPSRMDFCFFGPRYCRSGDNIGLVCATDADCPNSPPGNDCVLATSFPVTDDGTCPIGLPRAATARGIGVPAIIVIAPCNFATYEYHVSADAAGECVVVIPNEPDSACRDENDDPFPFITVGATFVIPLGQCCDGSMCIGDFTETVCQSMGGAWNPAGSCVGPIVTECVCQTNANCNDNNCCTTDICNPSDPQSGINGCRNISNVPPGQCCHPNTCVLQPIDDGNECTVDMCGPLNGQVSHTPTPGVSCQDDGNPCTLDRCDAMGTCAHEDITAIACTTDAECVAASGGASQTCGQLNPGLCDCVANPPLTIECDEGDKPNPECFLEDEKVTLRVVLGSGTLNINGGQFQLNYDPTCLDFNSIVPGNLCDPGSAFELPIFTEVNEASGSIFYAVGVGLSQGNGTNDGGVLACISFNKIGACSECNVCFGNENPRHTYLSGPGGAQVDPEFPDGMCGCQVKTNGATTIVAPFGAHVNVDCDAATAVVTWDAPVATDSCDGALDLTCTCFYEPQNPGWPGFNCLPLAMHGGEFPQGITRFSCLATDSCGQVTGAHWEVDVEDQTLLDVVLQLSPTMTPNQLHRCIEFGFYSNCVEAPLISKEIITFGPPFDFPGHASYQISVPKGQFACLTARDQLHTLRAVSNVECIDNVLHAEFKGDPFFGGNWLIGGNLDGSHVIDVLDFGVLISQYLKNVDPDTNCDQKPEYGFYHADVNGDGMVDLLDFLFIQGNFLEEDKDSCCPDTGFNGGAAGKPAPVLSIGVEVLTAMGLHELRKADLNRDEVLDERDMEALMAGVAPVREGVRGKKAESRVR